MTEDGGNETGQPGVDRIRSIAVHRDDIATALEATLRSDSEVVLRVTPPFSGRMRARLHALDADGSGRAAEDSEVPSESESAAGEVSSESESAGDAPAPVRVDPRDLVADVPPYPEVDDTAAAYPDADVATRRQRHAEAVEAWRDSVRERVVSTVELGGDESRAVDVTPLG